MTKPTTMSRFEPPADIEFTLVLPDIDPPTAKVIEITVPDNIKAGENLAVEGPFGRFEGPIPEGLKPGDTYQVKIDTADSGDEDRIVTVVVPEDGEPGKKLVIDGPLGKHEVAIPEGLKPGDKFNVKVGDSIPEPSVVEVTVPEDGAPGNQLVIDGPLGKFEVAVPEDLKPGDKFRVKIDEPNPEPKVVEVIVPEGEVNGKQLLIDGPLGKFEVAIPEGLKAGEKFHVKIDESKPEAVLP